MEAESEGAFQSDIMMTDEQWASLWAMLGDNVQGNDADAGRRRKKRKAVAFQQRRWPLKTVPYEISSESGKLTIVIYINFADDNHNLFFTHCWIMPDIATMGGSRIVRRLKFFFSKKHNFGHLTGMQYADGSNLHKSLSSTKESVHFSRPL